MGNALAGASSQVSASSQTLSQGTSEQAASVEETTASLEQMSASITQNAENGRQTEQMAVKGAKDAEDSGRAVSETIEAMRVIAENIAKREQLQRDIAGLAADRDAYIEAEVDAEGGAADSLDQQIFDAVREQAAPLGLDYEGGPKF